MIKDIVVHLTGSDEDEIRLSYAEFLSERFEAHVRGFYVHRLPELISTSPFAMAGMPAMTTFYEEQAAQAGRTLTRLKERFDRLVMPHDVQQVDVYSGTAGKTLALRARTADLFVATRPYGDPADDESTEVEVLFGSGRACLFLPPNAPPPTKLGTVVVAWNGSREAARAVAEALPILKLASQAVVVGITEGEEPSRKSDIARHLSRHGVPVVLGDVDDAPDGIGAALLGEVSRLDADLLVMGGYGHSRLRELVLGGATRFVLVNSTVPVLMAR